MKDIIYIKDVISAFKKALINDNAQGLYNIASGKYLTLWEEARTIGKVFWGDDSKPIIIERPEKENHIDAFLYDIRKAKNELNWSPRYSFEGMLLDYKKEEKKEKFSYLVKKRKKMLSEGQLEKG